MLAQLKDKWVVVTGASAGIGEATALEFAKAGSKLILAARRIDRLVELARKINIEFGIEVHSLSLDLCDNASIESFVKNTHQLTPKGIDVLVSNAGLALGTSRIAEGDPEQWDTVWQTNVTGTLRCVRGFLPQMLKKNSGHLIFLSSIAAHQTYDGGSVYCASKHAVRALAATLRSELCESRLRVSTIDPGMVETEFSKVRFAGDEQRAALVYKGFEALTAEDIAECVVFAASRKHRVNINEMIVMPQAQASVYKVHKSTHGLK